LDAARASYQEANQILERLVREHDSAASYRAALAKGYDSLGALYELMGRMSEAEAPWQESFRLNKRLAEDDPESAQALRSLAISHIRVGQSHSAARRLTEAVGYFTE